MALSNFYHKHHKEIKHISLCILGSFILAFGTAAFLIPAEIVAGGTSGVGMLVSYFTKGPLGDYMATVINNIVVWSINISLLIISFFFVGKKFALHTLVSTVSFPAFYSLMTLTPMLTWLTQFFLPSSSLDYALRIVLAGILAGTFIGIGVSITFLGGGSSGGLDVIYFLGYKYLKIKQSISSFVLDAVIIIVYATATADHIQESLMGVASAFISAIMIEIIYVRPNRIYSVEISTRQYEQVMKYLAKENIQTLNTKKSKTIQINIPHREIRNIRKAVLAIDAKAELNTINLRYLANKEYIK